MTDKIAAGRDRQPSRIIATDVEPGPRNKRATLQAVLAVLDRRDVAAAIDRLRAGHGLHGEMGPRSEPAR